MLILGFEQNVLSEEEIDHIWKPNVGYTNAKLGTRHVEILGLMVRRESDALPFDFSSDVEGKKYLKIYSNNFKYLINFLVKICILRLKVNHIISDKIYPGQSNSLVLKCKVYAEYGCVFGLRNFPFDSQNCSMNFTMDSAKAEYIKLVPKNITFQVTH